jgi:hypothetical protein
MRRTGTHQGRVRGDTPTPPWLRAFVAAWIFALVLLMVLVIWFYRFLRRGDFDAAIAGPAVGWFALWVSMGTGLGLIYQLSRVQREARLARVHDAELVEVLGTTTPWLRNGCDPGWLFVGYIRNPSQKPLRGMTIYVGLDGEPLTMESLITPLVAESSDESCTLRSELGPDFLARKLELSSSSWPDYHVPFVAIHIKSSSTIARKAELLDKLKVCVRWTTSEGDAQSRDFIPLDSSAPRVRERLRTYA